MNALTFLNNLRPAIPYSSEQLGKIMSNSELIRHMKSGTVLINTEKVDPKEEIDFPVFSIVFFPNSKKRRTTLI